MDRGVADGKPPAEVRLRCLGMNATAPKPNGSVRTVRDSSHLRPPVPSPKRISTLFERLPSGVPYQWVELTMKTGQAMPRRPRVKRLKRDSAAVLRRQTAMPP